MPDCCFLQIRDESPYHKSHQFTQGKETCPDASSLLSSERAALGESGLTTGRLAKDGGAALADDNGLGVGEDGGDDEAAGALDVHEEGSGGGDKSLELVLLGLSGRGRVQKINGENHLGGLSRKNIGCSCENRDA